MRLPISSHLHQCRLQTLSNHDTSILEPAYWWAFFDEYTQHYSIIPLRSLPSGLLNSALCIPTSPSRHVLTITTTMTIIELPALFRTAQTFRLLHGLGTRR